MVEIWVILYGVPQHLASFLGDCSTSWASGMDKMDKLGNYLKVTMSIYDSPKLCTDHGNELGPCTHQWETQNEMGIIQ
ncbi:hypothetical protein PM082_019228 [Marasmius tenuissimus]|nr:hypothetical protein PM082_019228 [Marasmius tenuissimus]